MTQPFIPAPIWYSHSTATTNGGLTVNEYCGVVQIGRIAFLPNGLFTAITTFPFNGRERTYGTEGAAQDALEQKIHRRLATHKNLILNRDFQWLTDSGVWLYELTRSGEVTRQFWIQGWSGQMTEHFHLASHRKHYSIEEAVRIATVCLNSMNIAE